MEGLPQQFESYFTSRSRVALGVQRLHRSIAIQILEIYRIAVCRTIVRPNKPAVPMIVHSLIVVANSASVNGDVLYLIRISLI